MHPRMNNRKLGTPDESTWPGISKLEDYSPLFPKFPIRSIAKHVPSLDPLGVDLLSVSMLKLSDVENDGIVS